MLEALARAEKDLPDLLLDEEGWRDLYVDYSKPIVERLWRPWEDYRLYCHLIHPCDISQALFHPHGWASAMAVYGEQVMNVGYGPGEEPPPVALQINLRPGTRYEMSEINGWHAVAPVKNPSFSLMITGRPWNRWSPKSDKPLRGLTPEERRDLFALARWIYPSVAF